MLIIQRKAGEGSQQVQLLGGTINTIVVGGPGDAQGGIIFHADGTVTTPLANTTTPSPIDNWLIAAPSAGAGSLYEIKATHISGTAVTVGTMDTWLNPDGVTSTRWATNSSSGLVTTVLQFEIRAVSTTTVLATGTYTINVTKS